MRYIQPQRNCTPTASQARVITTSQEHLTVLKIKAWGNTEREPKSAGGIYRGSGRSQGMACTRESLKINLRYLGLEPMRLLNIKIYWLCAKQLGKRATLSPKRCEHLIERHAKNSGWLSDKRKKTTLNSTRRCRSNWRTKWSRRSRSGTRSFRNTREMSAGLNTHLA